MIRRICKNLYSVCSGELSTIQTNRGGNLGKELDAGEIIIIIIRLIIYTQVC
jgi:hypothetical protein